MRKRKKSDEFNRDLIRRKGKRESRDEIFAGILNTSYLEQRQMLADWMYTEILDLKYIINNLRSLTEDNISVATLEHFETKVREIENTLKDLLKTKFGIIPINTTPEDEAQKSLDLDIEDLSTAFNDFTIAVIPVIRDLIVIRNLLDNLCDVSD